MANKANVAKEVKANMINKIIAVHKAMLINKAIVTNKAEANKAI